MKTTGSTALLIIDVQLGMFQSPLIPPVHDHARLLATLAGLVQRARRARVPIIYVQHGGGKGHPLEQGTAPWRIHPVVAPKRGEPVVRKRYCDSFQQTELGRWLKARSIRHLVVAGIQSEFCVDTACRRAFSLGYQVTLVENGHSTWDNGALRAEQIIQHHNRTLASQFVTLAAAESLFALRRKAAKA